MLAQQGMVGSKECTPAVRKCVAVPCLSVCSQYRASEVQEMKPVRAELRTWGSIQRHKKKCARNGDVRENS